MLLFLLLRHLRARGLSRRTEVDDLWLTALFGVGSVYYFCSVVGQVWFTRADRRRDAVDRLRVGVAGGARARCWRGCSSRSASRRGRRGWWSRCSLRGGARRSAAGTALRTREGRRALAPRDWLRFALPIAVVGDRPGVAQLPRASATRSSSGTSSSPCSGRSGCSASACSTITSCRATSPPR